MKTEIERILDGMSEEFLRTGTVAVAEWVRQYPEHRAEIIEYRLDLELAPTAQEIEAEQGPWPDVGAARVALTRHGQAIGLGDAWLQDSVAEEGGDEEVEEGIDPDTELARELARVRSTGYLQEGKTSQAFRKAVVITWSVKRLAARNRRTSRFTMTKVCYLLEQAMGLGVFQQHTRQRWGPYDSASKYKDAEPIIRRGNYLLIRGTSFEPGPNVDKVEAYASGYLHEPNVAERLLDRLSSLSDQELETWTTVHWAATDLLEGEHTYDQEAISRYLGEHSEWRPKLSQANFRAERIEAALSGLRRLGLLPEPAI
jgi:hypothetical protein